MSWVQIPPPRLCPKGLGPTGWASALRALRPPEVDSVHSGQIPPPRLKRSEPVFLFATFAIRSEPCCPAVAHSLERARRPERRHRRPESTGRSYAGACARRAARLRRALVQSTALEPTARDLVVAVRTAKRLQKVLGRHGRLLMDDSTLDTEPKAEQLALLPRAAVPVRVPSAHRPRAPGSTWEAHVQLNSPVASLLGRCRREPSGPISHRAPVFSLDHPGDRGSISLRAGELGD